MPLSIRCSMLVLAIIGLVSPAIAVVEPSSADKLRFLVAQSSQMNSRIASCTFQCERDHTAQGGPAEGNSNTWHSVYQVWQRGNDRSESIVTVFNSSQQWTSRAVLTDHYFADARDDVQGSQYLYESLRNASAKVKGEIQKYDELDLMRFAFGDAEHFFTEWAFFTMPAVQWRVEAEGEVYKVVGTNVITGSLERMWLIDSSKNFVIRGVTDYDDNGKTSYQMTMVPAKIGEFWLPATAEVIRYRGGNNIIAHTKWMFSHHQVNVPFQDDLFSIAFLQLPSGRPVMQTQADGTRTLMIYVNGKLMP